MPRKEKKETRDEGEGSVEKGNHRERERRKEEREKSEGEEDILHALVGSMWMYRLFVSSFEFVWLTIIPIFLFIHRSTNSLRSQLVQRQRRGQKPCNNAAAAASQSRNSSWKSQVAPDLSEDEMVI